MARQKIINGGDDAKKPVDPLPKPAIEFRPDDEKHDEELRPQRLEDIVGQRKAIERLRIMLDAAKKRNEPLGHLLFDGPPGLGKTTFATVIPKELGTDFQIASAPALTAPKDILPYVTNATFGSVLFIDEIHRLPPAVEEFIYPVMEDFRVDISLGEGMNARTINMPLKKFTLIGATTRSGMLTAPLRDRFVNRLHVDFYDEDDLAVIVTRNARKLRTEIETTAAAEIATRSRGTPRKANNLLYWCRDYADSRGAGTITADIAKLALEMIEVDQVGLDELDRKYLLILVNIFAGGPAGLSAIGHSMNCPVDTLEDEIEPFLLRVGFLQRTPRGRVVTSAGLAHLGIAAPPPGSSPQGTLF